MTSAATPVERGGLHGFGARSVVAGIIGAFGMAVFYVVVVAGVSDSWSHLSEEATRDWYLLLLVIAGFGIQVTLFAELRRRNRLQVAAATASSAGAGASGVGMVACCAHHIADLLPFLGASGVAAFLYDYRVAFVLVGVGINAVGFVVAGRRLRRTSIVGPMPSAIDEETLAHEHGPAVAARPAQSS